jgi:proteasome lid subunit RPN8/RPN11
MRVMLSDGLRDAILGAARTAHPRECCGLVVGIRDGQLACVTALYPARNLCADAARFEIDPADHIAAQKAARACGHGVIGCYHSHPHGLAEPSATDLAGAGEDKFLWLIAADETVVAFVYFGGTFRGCVTGAD